MLSYDASAPLRQPADQLGLVNREGGGPGLVSAGSSMCSLGLPLALSV